MKKTVKKIETAIRDLYRIDVPFSADDFLMNVSGIDENLLPQGSLFIQEEEKDLSVGIYFNQTIQTSLSRCESIQGSEWTPQELNAFATAAEEISHFLYLVFQANQGRKLSQFDLELQGEIDKFLLLFFQDASQNASLRFDALYQTVFKNFRWHPTVTDEQRERYEDANNFAKKFTTHLRPLLCNRNRYPDLMKKLRDYYRLSPTDKMSYLHRS